MSNKSTSTSVGCGGCTSFIIGGLVIWAFIFGVTYDGKHHDVSCSCNRGVVIDTKQVPR